MSSVKITDLPAINTINANTANTVLVGVDIPTNVTGKITLTTLATGLFSNNNLVVGNNYTVLPNVVGQFTGNSASYLQVNLENQTSSGSGDFVVTADDGTDSNHYIDMGLNGSTFSDSAYSSTKAHDGYLYVSSTGTNKGNLSIGTTNSTGKVNFVVGGMETANIVGYVSVNGIFSAGIDSVVSANAASANSVINTRVSANVATIRGEITGNVATLNGSITSNITTQNTFTQAAYNKANTALANTSGTFGGNLTLTGYLSPEKGIVYTPNTIINTGFTIDFTRDSLVKLSVNADATIGLGNYQAGKVVDMIVYNSAAQNKTLTHGCLANNTTNGGTTITIPSLGCLHLKYFSFDGDHANTFVSITH